MTGRPRKHGDAPRASGEDVRARADPPVGVDLDLVGDGFDHLREGGALAIAGSACRPPCVDTHTAAAPLYAARRVVAAQHALDDHR